MDLRIYAAVEWRDPSRSEPTLKLIESLTAGVAQHQIEVRESARANVSERVSLFDLLKGHRRVEIIEHAKSARIEDEIGGSDSVGAIRRHHRHIGIGEIARCGTR